MTGVVRSLAGRRDGMTFAKVGARRLKGIPEAVEVHSLVGALGDPPASGSRRGRTIGVVSVTAGVIALLAGVLARGGARLVRMTPRGLGGEPILMCPEVVESGTASIEAPLLAADSIATYRAAVADCAARWDRAGIDRSAYDLADIALDARDLILALDQPSVGLMATQTYVPAALEALRFVDGPVDHVTISNPVSTTPAIGDFVDSFAESLGALDSLCRDDPKCRALSGDLLAEWRRAYERARTDPTLVTAPLGDEVASVLLDGDRLAAALSIALGLPELQTYIPLMLSAYARPGLPDRSPP